MQGSHNAYCGPEVLWSSAWLAQRFWSEKMQAQSSTISDFTHRRPMKEETFARSATNLCLP